MTTHWCPVAQPLDNGGEWEVPMAEQPFTDDEYAFLRHARFGELPLAVRPDERVALTETDPGRDRPEEAEDPIRSNVQG
ncbi:hypothetical protein [Micromonospora zamorensis]|uniref:hypothetical protein n=1 Tax=Micromonospora zamorensis TaxID=709883 RepID=UPI003CF929B9